MGNWTTIKSGGSTVASTVNDAPNILSGSGQTPVVAPSYGLIGDLVCYGYAITNITLPVANADYVAGRLKKIHIAEQLSDGLHELNCSPLCGSWASSPLSITEYPSAGRVQPSSSTSRTLIFSVENDNEVISANPVSVTVTVQASAVTSISSPAENTANRTVDPNTRMVHVHPSFVPVFNGNQIPQVVSYWKSKDGGVNYIGVGFAQISTIGQSLSWDDIAPSVDQTWKVACHAGALNVDPYNAVPAASLPAGTVASAGFSVVKAGLPAATLITSLTVASGGSGSWPYNAVSPDGMQYFDIPSVSYNDSGCLADANAFSVRVTAQDYDASHNAVGPEQAFFGDEVGTTGATHASGHLMGQYGTTGYGYTRTGNVSEVRLRVYVCNRLDGSDNSFENALCAVLQTGVGSGAWYVTVPVAAAGAIPPGAVDPVRLATAKLGANLAVSTVTGKLDALNSVGVNLLANAGAEQDLQGWSVNNVGATLVTATAQNHTYAGTRSFTLGAVQGSGGASAGQTFTADDGDIYMAGAWVYGEAGNNAQVYILVAFYSAAGLLLAQRVVATANTPASTWTYYSGISSAAPAGTGTVLMAIVLSFLGSGTGNIYVDDTMFCLAPKVNSEFSFASDGSLQMQGIDLTKVVSGSYSNEFHIDPSTGKWSMLGVDMSKATNLSAQFTTNSGGTSITSLSADLLMSGKLQIGGGSNKVSLAKFFDTSATPQLMGFIGDDSADSGYVGAWFQRCGIGGSGPLHPGFFADSSGNVVAASVYIADATGASGYIGSGLSWFQRLAIGGADVAHAQLTVDVHGNLSLQGSVVVGAVASATTAGSASSASYASSAGSASTASSASSAGYASSAGSSSTSGYASAVPANGVQSGTLGSGVLYSGTIYCDQLNVSRALNMGSGTFEMNDGVGHYIWMSPASGNQITTSGDMAVTGKLKAGTLRVGGQDGISATVTFTGTLGGNSGIIRLMFGAGGQLYSAAIIG